MVINREQPTHEELIEAMQFLAYNPIKLSAFGINNFGIAEFYFYRQDEDEDYRYLLSFCGKDAILMEKKTIFEFNEVSHRSWKIPRIHLHEFPVFNPDSFFESER